MKKFLWFLPFAIWLIGCGGASINVKMASPTPLPTAPPLFEDKFAGNGLDSSLWDVFQGSPVIGDGKLILAGNSTQKAEVQSKFPLQSGVLHATIESPNWGREKTDSSFGFEIWDEQCHYAVIFKASGHLAILRAQPDDENKCVGDPAYQNYQPISNWNTIRTSHTLSLTLSWSSSNVALNVKGSDSSQGGATYAGETIPSAPLRIRLNADLNETYSIDYVRVDPAP